MLLLCLVRTLLPEVWVLTLHAHRHTAEVATARRQGKALVSPCHTEQFYNVAYAVAGPTVGPRRQLCYQAPTVVAPRTYSVGALRLTALRGPPQG